MIDVNIKQNPKLKIDKKKKIVKATFDSKIVVTFPFKVYFDNLDSAIDLKSSQQVET